MKTKIFEQFNDQCSSKKLFEERYCLEFKTKLKKLKFNLFIYMAILIGALFFLYTINPLLFLLGFIGYFIILSLFVLKSIKLHQRATIKVLDQYYWRSCLYKERIEFSRKTNPRRCFAGIAASR